MPLRRTIPMPTFSAATPCADPLTGHRVTRYGVASPAAMIGYETRLDLPQARLFPPQALAEPAVQPLDDPVWTDGNALGADDPVLGLYLNRRARALPWSVMRYPHVANLVLDRPVLVTLCPVCSGAAAFRSELEGRRVAFRLRGRYNGTMLLEDRSTGSLWSPFTGVALAGPARGARLERLPLAQCLWSEWLSMHPDSLVLHGEPPPGADKRRTIRVFPGSPGIGASFLATLVREIDNRLAHNVLVLGVESGTSARAYPLETLARIGPALNDALGGTEILVRSRPGTFHALAFHRRVADRVLSFRSSAPSEVYDEETKSVWNEMGEAVSGPLQGTQLAYVHSGVEEWYAFAAYHPGVDIFGPG